MVYSQNSSTKDLAGIGICRLKMTAGDVKSRDTYILATNLFYDHDVIDVWKVLGERAGYTSLKQKH